MQCREKACYRPTAALSLGFDAAGIILKLHIVQSPWRQSRRG